MSLGEAGPRCVVRWVEQAVKREQGSWAPRQELGFSSEGTAVCVVLSRILGSEPRTLALGGGEGSAYSPPSLLLTHQEAPSQHALQACMLAG